MRFVCLCGYHVCEAIWGAVAGETLACGREPRNIHDRYAAAVKKEGTSSAIYQELFLEFARCS